MTTNEPTRRSDKSATDDDEKHDDTLPLESVSTPIDHTLRSFCEAEVRPWSDCDVAFVSIDLEIGAVEPVEVTLTADNARRLAEELHSAADDADEKVDELLADD